MGIGERTTANGDFLADSIGSTDVGRSDMGMFSRRSNRKKSRKSKRNSKNSSRHNRRSSKKRRSSSASGRKVYFARKTGQPYIKLANGRAKFIKGKRHR